MNQTMLAESGVERSQFDRDGCLALQGLFTAKQIDRAALAARSLLSERPREAAAHGLRTERRTFWSQAEDAEGGLTRSEELYLRSDDIRELALESGLLSILEDMLGEPAVLFRSTYFPRGRARTIHIDSQDIPMRHPQTLLGVWIAFEDVHPDAGPVVYFPGSHKIPLYCFNDGSHHASPEEEADWFDYVDVQIRLRRLKERRFLAKKGDALVWHANLVHGGSTIRDASRTRSSMVCRYYGETDCRDRGFNLAQRGESRWLRW